MYISYFRRHLNKHKCPLVTSDANCDICERDPETFYKLKNHIQVNQSRKIIPCQDCGKKFKTVQELKTHSVVHSGNKPYVCHICDEKFTQSSSLKMHYARHQAGTVGVDYFSCSDCGKQCKTFAALKSHRKHHTIPNQTQPTIQPQMTNSSPFINDGALTRDQGVVQGGVTLSRDQTITLPQLFLQPDLLSLDQLSQFQVTTINIEGLTDTNQGPGQDVDTGFGVTTLVGDQGEFKIQIIDDLSHIG